MQVTATQVRRTLRAIRLTPDSLLSSEEMVILHHGWKTGINRADCLDAMVSHNYGLIKKSCSPVTNRDDFLDCCQHGVEGLMRAIEKWEPERGLRFSTYATAWIDQKIYRYRYNKMRMIRVPEHALVTASKVYRAYSNLAIAGNDEPSVEQVAQEAQVSTEKVAISYELRNLEPASIDARIGTSDMTIGDSAVIGTHESAETEYLDIHADGVITAELEAMDAETRHWVVLHLGLAGKVASSYHAIARRYGVPPVVVAERVRGAIARLKEVHSKYHATP